MSIDASGRRWKRTVRALVVGAAALTLVVMSPPPPGTQSLVRAFAGPAPAALVVDTIVYLGFIGDANGVLEPDESVNVSPSWRAMGGSIWGSGEVWSFTGPAAANYIVDNSTASYGTIEAGTEVSCLTQGECYAVTVAPNGQPRPLHWDASLEEVFSWSDGIGMVSTETHVWSLHVGDSFADVPRTHQQYRWIETMLHLGIYEGCGAGNFCPNDRLKRGDMAKYLLLAKEGAGYEPPACEQRGQRFDDVSWGDPNCPWIEELDRRVTIPDCAPGQNLYCPNMEVKKGPLAQFIVGVKNGKGFAPLSCVPGNEMFEDVPASDPDCGWIEELARNSMSGGDGGEHTCAPNYFCPTDFAENSTTSGMIVAGFNLSLYKP